MEYSLGNSICREQEHGAGGILSDSISILEKGFSSQSRDLQNSCALGVVKMYGQDLQTHSDSGKHLKEITEENKIE